MSPTADRLYALLPAIYRVRDAQQGEPLKALLSIIAEQVAALEENLAQLYDDHFVETCAEWVVPYIGDLVGARGIFTFPEATFSQRAQVANTLAYRRRKGTATVLEQLARDVTGWKQWKSTFGIDYTDKDGERHTGNDGFKAAVREGHFDAIVLSGGVTPEADQAITGALRGNAKYRLLTVLHSTDDYGSTTYRIWVKQ